MAYGYDGKFMKVEENATYDSWLVSRILWFI